MKKRKMISDTDGDKQKTHDTKSNGEGINNRRTTPNLVSYNLTRNFMLPFIIVEITVQIEVVRNKGRNKWRFIWRFFF